MLHTLFIDVASHHGLIACASPETVPASEAIDRRITDADLLPLMERVLKQAQWKHRDLTQIACVVGPGGFTSVRVGVSAANALAWALGIPSCGVHLSDLYNARLELRDSSFESDIGSWLEARSWKLREDCVWLHSTKKSELFLRGFGAHRSVAPEPRCMKVEEALAVIPNGAAIIGELIPEHQVIFRDHGCTLAELPSVETILPQFLAHQTYSKQALQPWYGRGI